LTWLLHPLIGSVAALTTGLYYLLRSPGTSVRRRILLAAVFSAGVLSTVALGTVAHVGLYDRPVPFYFSPELYLWTDGPGGVESHWLSEPTVPGLTKERITTRFAELGLSDKRRDETLALFEAHTESIRNPVPFTLHRLFRYGQLTFNPLVLFCILLACASIRRGHGGHRAETVWVLVTAAGLVAASVALRAVPGSSFGDRHLLPVVPLLVASGGLAVATVREDGLFRALVLLSMAIMFPGAISPWATPGDVFLAVNLGVTLLALFGAVMVWRSAAHSRIARSWEDLRHGLPERRLAALVAGVMALEVLLYLAILPSA
jgi:hypothetical protein